jgi:hypothetical protein
VTRLRHWVIRRPNLATDAAAARGHAAWPFVFATLAVLAPTLVVALFFFRNTLRRDCGLCDDAASSVSQAPGP